jgi:hypothetical protein
MNSRWTAVAAGLAWIALSPLLLLMALISKHGSLTEYYVMLIAFGGWSVAGVIAGIGTIVSARWAARLIAILSWLAAVFFGGAGLLMLGYLIVLSRDRAERAYWLIATAVIIATSVLSRLFVKRRRAPTPAKERSSTPPSRDGY